MIDQNMPKLDTESFSMKIMKAGITSQKLEKSERNQIWQDLQMKGKLSKQQEQAEAQLAKELIEFYQKNPDKDGQAKQLSDYFSKNVKAKVEVIYKNYIENTIRLQQEVKMKNDLNYNSAAYFQPQQQQYDPQQLKYLQQINFNTSGLMGMPMTSMPTNSTSFLQQYPGMMNSLYNNLQFQQSTPTENFGLPYGQIQLSNYFMHPQSNQGVPQLQQTYMYNKPHEISGINTAAYTTPQSYMNQLNLGQQVGFSLPQSIYGSQFINQQQAAEAQTQIDPSRSFNNYFNTAVNGFAKGAENTQYQVDQLMQIQANQPTQQQKIVQAQKQIQAPYPLQNQQQQQFQISQQYQQQAQLNQQQQLQAQSQQRQTAQPAAQKQKQQTSSSSTLPNISQSNQPFSLAINGSNNKQVQSAVINNSSSNKNSKLGVSEIPPSQKQSANQTSSKSKSKSSNNSSTINLLQQAQIPMNNQFNAYTQSRNGAIPNQVKGIETEAIKSCICAYVPRLRNPQSELIQCKNKGCEHKLHLSCMRISPKDEESITQFECPSCILKKYDPLHHVEQTLIDCCAIMGIPNKQLDFVLTPENYAKIKDHNEYSLEIRCIRIDGTKNIYETTWPDFGNLKMNNEVILDLKPLQNNSSLKKRKDEKHTFKGAKNLKEGVNHLTISEFTCNIIEKQQLRITENALHCISVFIIRRLTVDQLVANIRRENTRPADECKQQIQDYFNRQNKKSSHEEDDDEICIDSLSVPLTCSLDMKLIQTPAKGRFCKHFQCFSLENFIITTETVNPRKWKCNICKAKCYDIIVDEYILKIIQEINEKQIKNVTDVKFDGKGQYSFDQQSYSDDDDDYDDDSKPIVKKPSQNQASTPAPAAPQPITVSPTNALQAIPIQTAQAQVINKAPINGNNNPKGVSLESHSNSNALESQQLQIQDQVSGGNKKKSQPQQILVIDSDEEEPPIQKKAQTVAPAPTQILQQAPLQIQQLQQNGQPHHHHLNIPQNNFPANIQNGSVMGIHQNTNLMNLNQATNINGLQYKNLQNANSHQTSNTTGFNTVNSQNINQMIPLINKDKDQSSNQSSKNIITKSKKTVMCEEENKETSKIQNQTNKNNNNQQKTPSNHKEQKLSSEEVQREVPTNRNNTGNAPSSTTSLSSLNETAFSKAQKKQMEKQQMIQDNLHSQNHQYIVQNIVNNQQQQLNQFSLQQKQQNNPKRIASNQDQPILIESPKSEDLFKEGILQQMAIQKQIQQQQLQQQQQQQQKQLNLIQQIQNEKNVQQSALKLINMTQQVPQIGINSQDYQKQIQLTNIQKTQQLDHMQKMEEMSVSASGELSKSNIHVGLSDKDIQNIERKRIQKEQSLDQQSDGKFQYFEDFIGAQGQNSRYGSSQDLQSKQKQNLNNSNSGSIQGSSKKSQQNVPINNIIVKTLQSNGQSETVPVDFELQNENSLKRKITGQNNANQNEGLSKKRIFEKITNIGKEDNPITIDD
ncbi:hypothetical protein ABPG74_012796 [Tetrahymena malaccensis]